MAQAPPDPEFTIPGSPEKRADEHVDRLIEQSRSDYARMKDMDTQELLDQRGWMKTVIWNQRMGRRLDRSDQLTADMVSDDPAVVKRARATLVRRWRKIERDRGTARPEFVGQVQDAIAEAHRNPTISGFAAAHPVHVQAAATAQPGRLSPQAEYDPGTKRITVYDQHAEGGSGGEALEHGDVTADEITKPDLTTASHGRDVAVYRHEFGHFVQDTLGDDPRVHEFQAEWEKYRAEYEQALASADVYAERRQITSNLLSFYSTTNWREGFAEAWTITSSPGFTDDHINDDRYSPSAQRMLRLTQEIARDYAPATTDRGRERDGGAGAGGEPSPGGAGVSDRIRGSIQKNDIVRSKSSGRLYRVNDAMVPANASRRSHTTYDVTDLETGLVNAFDGSEIEKVSKRDQPAGIDTEAPDRLDGPVTTTVERPSLRFQKAGNAYFTDHDGLRYAVRREGKHWGLYVHGTEDVAGVPTRGQKKDETTADSMLDARRIAEEYAALGNDYRSSEHGHRGRMTEAVRRAYAPEDATPVPLGAPEATEVPEQAIPDDWGFPPLAIDPQKAKDLRIHNNADIKREVDYQVQEYDADEGSAIENVADMLGLPWSEINARYYGRSDLMSAPRPTSEPSQPAASSRRQGVGDEPVTDWEYETHVEPTAEENWRDAHGGRDPRANDADWAEFLEWAKILRQTYDGDPQSITWRD